MTDYKARYNELEGNCRFNSEIESLTSMGKLHFGYDSAENSYRMGIAEVSAWY